MHGPQRPGDQRSELGACFFPFTAPRLLRCGRLMNLRLSLPGHTPLLLPRTRHTPLLSLGPALCSACLSLSLSTDLRPLRSSSNFSVSFFFHISHTIFLSLSLLHNLEPAPPAVLPLYQHSSLPPPCLSLSLSLSPLSPFAGPSLPPFFSGPRLVLHMPPLPAFSGVAQSTWSRVWPSLRVTGDVVEPPVLAASWGPAPARPNQPALD